MKLKSLNWVSVYRAHPKDLTLEMLKPCTGDELEAMCRLLGVPHSGTKTARVARILDMANLRCVLATWGEYADDDYGTEQKNARKIGEEVSSWYKRPELVAFAKRARVWRHCRKSIIVIQLLMWRDKCRVKGQKFNELIQKGPKQFLLPGFR